MRSQRSIPRLCAQCDAPFLTSASQIRRGRGLFCSPSCAAKSHRRDPALRFWEKVDKSGDCWLWTDRLSPGGYGDFRFDGKHHKAHRVAYELTHGPIPEGLFVCHTCDVRHCVNPDHLFLGTHGDNMRDMAQKGRSTLGDRNPARRYPERVTRGEGCHSAKFSEEQVREIRARLASGEAVQRDIAREYAVSEMTISRIARRISWAHVP